MINLFSGTFDMTVREFWLMVMIVMTVIMIGIYFYITRRK